MVMTVGGRSTLCECVYGTGPFYTGLTQGDQVGPAAAHISATSLLRLESVSTLPFIAGVRACQKAQEA